MNETFRPRPGLRYSMLACLTLFVPMGVICAIAIPQTGAALLGSGFCGFLAIGAMVMLLDIRRHRLTVTENVVEACGLFGGKQIPLAEVIEARWRLYSDLGRLVLKTAAGKVAINFSTYPREHAHRLILFFRNRLPKERQVGWEPFWEFYWSRFDTPDPACRERFAEETRWLRMRMDLWMVLGLLLTAGLMAWAYPWLREAQHMPEGRHPAMVVLIGLGSIVALWAFVRFQVTADVGKIRERVPPPDAGPAVAIYFGSLLLTITVPLAMAIYGFHGERSVFFGGCLIAFVVGLAMCIRLTRRHSRWQKEAARAAAKEYLEPGDRESGP
jgi:hypothetical protein